MARKIANELQPVYKQLRSEGYEVYTYTSQSNKNEEIHSLYWFENGRVLNIQPSSWYNARYARNCFNLSVSYIPSQENGTGCGLSTSDIGTPAEELLLFRNKPTWVRGATNYKSMEHFLQLEKVLKFHKI